jgi:catechol 2,3-dioxygenase-like lactoylglutathione lyase family enzyme
MSQSISKVTIVVKDYDEAINYYVGILGFILIEDTRLNVDKRWVVVAPNNTSGCQLLLARAANSHQKSSIGNQAGGRVFLFLQTDNFWEDYHKYLAAGVTFIEEPREEVYGTVVVFEDLYGNRWDLVQPKSK